MKEEDQSIQRSSSTDECFSNTGCYIAAKINNDLIGENGYHFFLGDEKTYGEFINLKLHPKQVYSINIAIDVWLPKVSTI